MGKYNKRNVCLLALSLVREKGMDQSEAMTLAWRNEKLHAMMLQGIVSFQFIKLDGTLRTAHGTIKGDLVPPTKGTGRPFVKGQQTYYDTDKGDWRCYKKDRLVKVG